MPLLPPGVVHDERDHQTDAAGAATRADLFRAGRAGIENAPRDVQMRLGIAVIQGVAAREAPRAARRGRWHGEQQRRRRDQTATLERSEFAELFKTGIDFGAREGAEALHAEPFAAKASHDGAVNHRAAQHRRG